MAGGDSGLGNRTITEDQNEEESASYQLMYKHFKENKVEIASAITKPYPFFMSLRDHGFISEEMFQDCQKRCKNLISVDSVVYDILHDVQERFSLELLRVIFSKTHLKAYPELEETLRNFFPNVSDNHRTFQRINGRDAEERHRLLAAFREASCSIGKYQINDEQAEVLARLPQCSRGEKSRSSCEKMSDGQGPQHDLSSPPRLEAASCSNGKYQINDEQAEELARLPQCSRGEESRSSCEKMSDGQEPQHDLSSPPRLEAGAAPSTSEKTCSCVMCSPTYVAEDQEASMGSSQEEAMDTRNNITVGESRKRRGRKKGHNQSTRKRRRPLTLGPQSGSRAGGQAATRRKKRKRTPGCSVQTRVLRRRRNETADFSAELLPVTCGNLKGTLYKDKFKQGTSVMSIQCEDGNWFTPQEFEIMGGHGRAKNWKLSLRCYNWPLKFLIKRNFLPSPPRKYARKKKGTQNLYHSQADPCMENSDECEVCREVGMLFCCDTCPRAFHEECHIPAVDAEITPWSCVFCRTQSLGSQESRPESEILQRQMVPQEQLKCEFVLLRVYCCPESSFFSKMPYYCYDRVVLVQEPMWLDIIKKKLSQQAYSKVKQFVQDMRLIFHNHRTTFKEPKFGQMGLQLESKFEKTFKEVFAIGNK
ncbi:nuclear body protein SP140-like isoform X3 [Psammomys obesus]|uniref:nuclear body protein SP140-like isoform X3 n=1 Tax=Psammomys obesus TaxID=48139 RepID=UPI002452A195|nr:nuclear body protein SP140-like isoform X3 [Psammomys obesus]